MKNKFLSILLIITMIFTMIPQTSFANEADSVYLSASDDSQYILDKDGNPVAYSEVSLEALSAIDLNSYGLGDYLYDADGDGNYEITALHLYIYVHEKVMGLNWSDVTVTGGAGSIYFAGGLFGFSDENLRYDYNGAYPIDEVMSEAWGYSVGATADHIVLSDGDFLNVAHYNNWNFYGDPLTGFHYFADTNGELEHSYSTNENQELTLSLVRCYSDWMNGGAGALAPEAGYEVSYGTSYGTATETLLADENGCVTITFPTAGTWYVWANGGCGEYYPDDIVSAPAFATINVNSTAEPTATPTAEPTATPTVEPTAVPSAEPIDVKVSIADKGEVVMANSKITVIDKDGNGNITVDEVLYAAHESAYEGGAAAGYASEETVYGLSIKTLWGDENGSYGYWLNDASCWSLADTVKDEDSLVAFVYQNTEVWDSYSKFTEDSYETMAQEAKTITLEKAGYDANWNTVFAAHNGASIKLYDADFKEVNADEYEFFDNGDGTYSVKVKNAGTYTIVAYDNATPIVPALCTLVVAENPNSEFVEMANVDHKAIYEATSNYIKGLGTPYVGSVGGEWMVIDLTRAGFDCPEGYYKNVVDYVNENINENEQLHKAKSTDNSRVILALTAAGYDVANVAGHNLLMGLTDMSYLKKQGINGPIWALIALDSHDYQIPENAGASEQVTREKIIAYILEKQLEDGGWALSGTVADPDMTGMAIQSLAPYYETDAAVKEAVDKALVCLSEKQHDNGGYGSVDGACSESCAQVIVALTALGINPETDERFVKNGVSVVDALCAFAIEGGGFEHVPHGGLNGMATEQGQYALAAYFRFLEGKTSLYDMSDVTINVVENILLGDVDMDGKINASDALLVLKHAAKIESVSDRTTLADINKDEKIDAVDALEILKYAAKLIDSFE